MDDTLDLLDTLLDGVTEPRPKLISADEARAVIMLLGLLDDTAQSEDIRRAAGEIRFRIGSRLTSLSPADRPALKPDYSTAVRPA
ncbi:hypothetical protein [Streptomyces vinaceus]|uniref:hypothetical protein n=1 Tax=Streptomyces vinaceus TaxID=1960 RepID=UPI001672DF33|nr:hypothetical protein [Streptomyces vinaceus]GHE76047.1 hypothetical protein GCM10017778_72240 [Streptomyces vinaceus]